MAKVELTTEFYDQLRRHHDELRQTLRETYRAISERSQVLPIADRLEMLQTLIDRHFLEEEESGFFRQIAEQAPWMTERADALRADHDDLRQQLGELVALGSASQLTSAWWDRLDLQFRDFSRRLMQHENGENEALQQAFDDDIGDQD